MGQASVAPAASLRYQRRNAAFLQEPDSDVHGWTEFRLSSLNVVFQWKAMEQVISSLVLLLWISKNWTHAYMGIKFRTGVTKV